MTHLGHGSSRRRPGRGGPALQRKAGSPLGDVGDSACWTPHSQLPDERPARRPGAGSATLAVRVLAELVRRRAVPADVDAQHRGHRGRALPPALQAARWTRSTSASSRAAARAPTRQAAGSPALVFTDDGRVTSCRARRRSRTPGARCRSRPTVQHRCLCGARRLGGHRVGDRRHHRHAAPQRRRASWSGAASTYGIVDPIAGHGHLSGTYKTAERWQRRDDHVHRRQGVSRTTASPADTNLVSDGQPVRRRQLQPPRQHGLPRVRLRPVRVAGGLRAAAVPRRQGHSSSSAGTTFRLDQLKFCWK